MVQQKPSVQPSAMGLFLSRAACSEGVFSLLYSFECKLLRGVILVEFRPKMMEYSSSFALSKILGFKMIIAESPNLPRRALVLPVVRMLYSIFFHFLG